MLGGSKWQERFSRYHQVSVLAQIYFDSPFYNEQIHGNTCLISCRSPWATKQCLPSKTSKRWILFVPSWDCNEAIIIIFYRLLNDSFNLNICLLVLRSENLISFRPLAVKWRSFECTGGKISRWKDWILGNVTKNTRCYLGKNFKLAHI